MTSKRQVPKGKRATLKGRAQEASGLPRLCSRCSTDVAKDWRKVGGSWL